MFEVSLDSRSQQILENFMNCERYFDNAKIEMAYILADKSLQHMRPMTYGVSEYYRGHHELADSLKARPFFTSAGFEITFSGLFYGLYMDEGNFPADAVISRAKSVTNPFTGRVGPAPMPVGLNRAGGDQITWVEYIHGMGHTTKGKVPTHYSVKTAEWLEKNMYSFTDSLIRDLFRKLVKP